MLNKKKIIIMSCAVLVLIIVLAAVIINFRKTGDQAPGRGENAPKPEFLTAEEKAYFRLDNNVKAQVLGRDASGTPTVYKLINNEYDVVIDPAKVEPISPIRTGSLD